MTGVKPPAFDVSVHYRGCRVHVTYGSRIPHHIKQITDNSQWEMFFFLDGPGGTGKSFLLEKLSHTFGKKEVLR
ncbi:hypothetical protein PHMEG_0009881 [Phytophthora megakarya]|uniref:Uncharacterized protein n=1 Tax=Phytophthora megakarya TaxID=4795 RepID=A0A225WFP0_9STRA|nr:hypothetical protein PHMEG_0009881 [Phytophthora megakarya]